jgi:DNA-binding response OmpR family regulator
MGARILVVEDSAVLALALAKAFNNSGFEVIGPVGTVAEALELIEKGDCDAAVLDINLGNETAEPIARELLARASPFVALTGYTREQLSPIFDSVAVLTKPVRAQTLLSALNRCLESGPP